MLDGSQWASVRVRKWADFQSAHVVARLLSQGFLSSGGATYLMISCWCLRLLSVLSIHIGRIARQKHLLHQLKGFTIGRALLEVGITWRNYIYILTRGAIRVNLVLHQILMIVSHLYYLYFAFAFKVFINITTILFHALLLSTCSNYFFPSLIMGYLHMSKHRR